MSAWTSWLFFSNRTAPRPEAVPSRAGANNVIRSVASGRPPADPRPPGPGRGEEAEGEAVAAAAPDTACSRSTSPPRRGRTVEGEVKNYVPVTDAMLRHPDPGDWLMIRAQLPGLEPQPARPRSRRRT